MNQNETVKVRISQTAGSNGTNVNNVRRVQRLRFYSQLFSLAINTWIGVQFFLFVNYLQSGGKAWFVPRPPGVEAWLPIGSVVSAKYWWNTGIVNDIHPSGLMILLAILLVTFLFKKGFCSWICPVGFFSEILGDISDKFWRRRIIPPRWLDYPLRSLKYIILGFFVWHILIQYTPLQIEGFLYSDYNVISDILMMRFFTDITPLALKVLTVIFVLSLVVRGFWCRFLCPYGALLGLLSFLSPTRIRREPANCTGCSSCATACPAFIKVDTVKEVVSDECIGCMACVESCPVSGALQIKAVSKKRTVSPMKWAAVLLIVFWGLLLSVKLWGPWDNSITTEQYQQMVEPALKGDYAHP